jgi:uncharacterized protein
MLKRVAFFVAGWMFLVLGAAGLVLPVLPGVVFLLLGLSFLSLEYAWARRWSSHLLRRFPAAERKLQDMLSKVRPSQPNVPSSL